MLTQITPKNSHVFTCEKCDFKCFKKNDLVRHLSTLKHKMLTNVDAVYAKKEPLIAKYICECGKEYKHRQSLWVHKNKCKLESDSESESELEAELKSKSLFENSIQFNVRWVTRRNE